MYGPKSTLQASIMVVHSIDLEEDQKYKVKLDGKGDVNCIALESGKVLFPSWMVCIDIFGFMMGTGRLTVAKCYSGEDGEEGLVGILLPKGIKVRLDRMLEGDGARVINITAQTSQH